jgi:hypothetical protein
MMALGFDRPLHIFGRGRGSWSGGRSHETPASHQQSGSELTCIGVTIYTEKE